MPVDIIEEPVVEPKDEPVIDDNDADPAADDGRAAKPTDEPAAPSPDPKDEVVFDVQAPKGLEKESEALRKQYRDAWLKKNSEKADQIRALEIERDRANQEATRRQAVIDQAAIGRAAPAATPAPEPIPEFQDMGQLTRYVEDRAALKAEAAVQTRVQQYEQRKAYEERWVSAWNTVAENDKTGIMQKPLFAKSIRNELMDRASSFLKFYNGQNEAEVIQKTVDAYRAFNEEYSESVRQQTIADMKRKTGAVTEKPAPRSVSVASDPKKQTKAEILAELREAERASSQ